MLIARTLRTMPGQVAGPLAQMAAAVAFTHWLSPGALGVYALAWAAQELVYYGVVAWWTSFVQRHAAAHADPRDRARLNAAETAIQLLSALLQAVVACAAIILVLDTMPTLGFLAALVAFTLTRNAATHFAARARAEDSDLAFTILQAGGPLGGLALGIFALSTIAPTAEALLIAYAIAQGLSLLAGLPLMRFTRARPRVDATMLRASWTYGAPLVVAHLFEWAANHGVRLIVEVGQGTEGVGLVTTAWWLGLRIAAFVALLVTGATFAAAIRALDTESPDRARRQLADNGALMLALLAPAVAGGALLSQAFANLAVAEPFREATALLLPFALAAGALKAFREHGPEQALLVFGRTRAAAMTALVEAVATAIFCSVGLILGGLLGAVAGAALASLAGAAFAQILAMRLTGYALRLADLARIAAATALMAAAVYALPHRADLAGLLLAVLIGALVYVIASLVLWRGHLRNWRTRSTVAA
jgi:O-antigen/teichoic acid export membrane protein